MFHLKILFFLGFAIVFAQAANFPPSITLQPNKFLLPYRENYSTQLTCRASGTNLKYRWKKNDEPFVISGNNDRMFQTPGEGTFTIKNPEKKDEGFYQCLPYNDYGEAATNIVQLRFASLRQVVNPDKRYVVTRRVTEGDYLHLECKKTYSFPEANIFWTKEVNSKYQILTLDNRISVDYNGDLHFAFLKKTDSSKYSCQVYNEFLRKKAITTMIQVQVTQAQSGYNTRPQLRISSPTIVKGNRGQTTILQCIFSGSPAPEVSWDYNLKRLSTSDKYEFQQYSNELRILNTEVEDSGEYTCLGRNSLSAQPTRQRIKLIVYAKPYLLEGDRRMKDRTAGKEENIEFYCKARGSPEPVYKWYINTEDVSTEQALDAFAKKRGLEGRVKISGNFFLLHKVKESDSLVVQCNASNLDGYYFQNAFVNILVSDKPNSGSSVYVVGLWSTGLVFFITILVGQY